MSRPKLSDKQLEGKVEEFQSVISSRKNMSAIKTGKSSMNVNNKCFFKNNCFSDKVFLLRLLKFYNGNMEKALKRLTVNMELRKSYSNIFFDRDTLNPRMRKLIDQV